VATLFDESKAGSAPQAEEALSVEVTDSTSLPRDEAEVRQTEEERRKSEKEHRERKRIRKEAQRRLQAGNSSAPATGGDAVRSQSRAPQASHIIEAVVSFKVSSVDFARASIKLHCDIEAAIKQVMLSTMTSKETRRFLDREDTWPLGDIWHRKPAQLKHIRRPTRAATWNVGDQWPVKAVEARDIRIVFFPTSSRGSGRVGCYIALPRGRSLSSVTSSLGSADELTDALTQKLKSIAGIKRICSGLLASLRIDDVLILNEEQIKEAAAVADAAGASPIAATETSAMDKCDKAIGSLASAAESPSRMENLETDTGLALEVERLEKKLTLSRSGSTSRSGSKSQAESRISSKEHFSRQNSRNAEAASAPEPIHPRVTGRPPAQQGVVQFQGVLI